MDNLNIKLNTTTIEIIIRLHFLYEVGADRLGEKDVFKWLTTNNKRLGNISPLLLINRGRGHRVLDLIKGDGAME